MAYCIDNANLDGLNEIEKDEKEDRFTKKHLLKKLLKSMV